MKARAVVGREEEGPLSCDPRYELLYTLLLLGGGAKVER